jgi:DNA polymerase-3 subunit beta
LADDADAFPTVQFLNEEDEGVSSFSLPSFVIKRGIQTTFFSILNDASRPNLNGVLFDIREDHLRFVSTDVQRLVLYRYNLETGINDSFILPLRSAAFLKALNVLDESVKVIYNPKNVLFKFADMEVISQLVEGKFPDYEKVMAFEAPLYVNIDRVDFLDALKRISIVSDQSSHYVELYIENNKLILKGKDLGLFIQGEENLRAETNIENKKVGFNGKLLSELLNNLDTVVVSMKMADEDGVPVKFEPAESEDENEKIEMMLVTMRLD